MIPRENQRFFEKSRGFCLKNRGKYRKMEINMDFLRKIIDNFKNCVILVCASVQTVKMSTATYVPPNNGCWTPAATIRN